MIVITCDTKSTLWAKLAFALLWCALTTYLCFKLEVRAADWNRDWPIYGSLLLIFPGGAIFLLLSALRSARRLSKFGESKLELKNDCALIGSPLGGLIRLTHEIEPIGAYKITLRCLETVTKQRSKGKSSEHTEVIWSESVELSQGGYSAVLGIPIDIKIPADAFETSDKRAKGRIEWSLELSAPTPGIDFQTSFSVPVYATED